MSFVRDSTIVFRRQVRMNLRNPAWVFIGVMQPVLYLVLFGPLMVFALLKLVAPGRFRDYASWAVMWIAETWAEIDKLIFALCIPTQWDIRGGGDLRGGEGAGELIWTNQHPHTRECRRPPRPRSPALGAVERWRA